jgi:hypothetical protein
MNPCVPVSASSLEPSNTSTAAAAMSPICLLWPKQVTSPVDLTSVPTGPHPGQDGLRSKPRQPSTAKPLCTKPSCASFASLALPTQDISGASTNECRNKEVWWYRFAKSGDGQH